jgi:hypothetical protein
MSRIVRAFLVWVMVIAMPVQGMAASTMLFCGPSHERMMQGLVLYASPVSSIQAHGLGHKSVGTEHGVHEQAVSGDSIASESAPMIDADGPNRLAPDHVEFSCSACAVCCSVLALPASFEIPDAMRPAHAVRETSAAPVTSHQPNGLDRPPRFVLA